MVNMASGIPIPELSIQENILVNFMINKVKTWSYNGSFRDKCYNSTTVKNKLNVQVKEIVNTRSNIKFKWYCKTGE